MEHMCWRRLGASAPGPTPASWGDEAGAATAPRAWGGRFLIVPPYAVLDHGATGMGRAPSPPISEGAPSPRAIGAR